MQILKGHVWKVGQDVDTDLIIAARYLNQSDPTYLAKHCLEDVFPKLNEKIKKGDILVAGKNFGCGSSREHAPVAIKHAGFSCVVAENYARIFYRNAINIGLPVIVSPETVKMSAAGDRLEVDPIKGIIRNITTEQTYQSETLPPFMMEILEKGGLIPYVSEKVKADV